MFGQHQERGKEYLGIRTPRVNQNLAREGSMTILTGNQIHKARLLALQAGMNLEAKGIRMNRGRTAMAIV